MSNNRQKTKQDVESVSASPNASALNKIVEKLQISLKQLEDIAKALGSKLDGLSSKKAQKQEQKKETEHRNKPGI